MNPADFTNPLTGSLVRTIEGQHAFVPAPLPPAIDLASIAVSMAEAMQAVGELKGACRRLQNPYMLVRPLQRQEALTSSAMEGTFTTDDNLLLAEAGMENIKDESTKEVINYIRALNSSIQLLRTLPISHRIIRRAHELLLSGLSSARGAQKRPGEYKKDQNWIGGRAIDAARFVPPPPVETQTCMDQLEAYINRERKPNLIPTPLMDLALVHYQLETIHPFADGNGRVGRMLISLMAINSNLLETPILYVSPALEKRKDEYIDLMFGVSARGNWSDWINFFFNIVTVSCRETIEIVDRIINLHENYREKVASSMRTANGIKLVDFLFESPVTTIGEAASKLGVTYPAAKATVDKLVEIGILSEYENIYPKAFVARGIANAARPVDREVAAPAKQDSPRQP